MPLSSSSSVAVAAVHLCWCVQRNSVWTDAKAQRLPVPRRGGQGLAIEKALRLTVIGGGGNHWGLEDVSRRRRRRSHIHCLGKNYTTYTEQRGFTHYNFVGKNIVYQVSKMGNLLCPGSPPPLPGCPFNTRRGNSYMHSLPPLPGRPGHRPPWPARSLASTSRSSAVLA